MLRPRFEALTSSAINALGAALATAGMVILIVVGADASGWRPLFSALVYGIALLASFASAALYHGLRGPELRRVFQALDHCAIFLLVAGTYTPLSLLTLQGHHGLLLFILVWTIALIGIAIRLFWVRRMYRWAPVLYVCMGFAGLPWIGEFDRYLETEALALIAAGGAAYLIGVVFFRLYSMRFGDVIWHGFVLAGAVLHYLAMAIYVLPGSIA